MTIATFLMLLVIAGICGSVGQALAGVNNRGLLFSIVVGLVGAGLGIWLAESLQSGDLFIMSIGSKGLPLLWSVIGSTLFALIIGLFSRRHYL